MTGFLKAVAIITKWNETTRKLTEDDIKVLAINLSSGDCYKRKSSWKKLTPQQKHDNLIKVFEENDNRIPKYMTDKVCGVDITAVRKILRNNGFHIVTERVPCKQRKKRKKTFHILIKRTNDE